MGSSEDTSNAQCRLLALPPEIRNRIYELVLIQPESVIVRPKMWLPPLLLQTCHEIRSEALGVYYGSNTFDVWTGLDVCTTWLKSLPAPARNIIKKIRYRPSYTMYLWDGLRELQVSHMEQTLTAVRESLAELGVGCNVAVEYPAIFPGKGKSATRYIWTSDPRKLWHELIERDASNRRQKA